MIPASNVCIFVQCVFVLIYVVLDLEKHLALLLDFLIEIIDNSASFLFKVACDGVFEYQFVFRFEVCFGIISGY